MKLRPKKSLGQHFLNSQHVLQQIIAAAAVKSGEVVLEIGPGTGILTTALLKAGASVIAVEKDDRAYELLSSKKQGEWSKEAQNLTLIHRDILELDTPKILPTSYSIVANIPYYITGAILEKFLEYEPRPSRMVLLAQKEVAERIVARPADGESRGKESVLSISVKAFGTPKIIARVPRGAFTPPPTVDSAILSIENISGAHFSRNGSSKDGAGNAKNDLVRRFFELVRAGFAHKRKFLIRNLETIVDKEKLADVWRRLDLNEKIRAEDLSVDDWLQIAAERQLLP